ncbi:MAG TPA: hypothetical protein VM910_09290 [Bradyrhizobium sp.]|nr:hypothetical protein [Bradyrhizobium sp.]
MRASTTTDTPTLAFRVKPFCKNIGIGVTKFYELVKAGKIHTVVIGGRRVIPVGEAERILREGCE